MNELEAQIQKVKLDRLNLQALKEELDGARQAFDIYHADLIASEKQAKADLTTSEAELRAMVLEEYKVTGNKRPAPGVGIRVVKIMKYDDLVARYWCSENNYLTCLELNKTNFNKVADGLKLDFVTIREEPQATIAKEL